MKKVNISKIKAELSKFINWLLMLIRTKYTSPSTSKVYMLTHDAKLALAATAMDLAVLGVD